MVSMRVHCFLLIFFTVQLLHAKFSNANFNSQVHQSENSEGFRASTITQISNKDIEGISKNRKMLKQRNPKLERNEKNGLEIESEEMVKKRNKKKLTKTVSLMADYTDATHHPPRHN